MNESLYFKDLFSKELKKIGNQLRPQVTISIQEILNDSRFFVKQNDDIYIIVPLFHVEQMHSDNKNDKVNENSIICEKNNNTILYFNLPKGDDIV